MKSKRANIQDKKRYIILVIFVILAMAATCYLLFIKQTLPKITSFIECVNAGYPVAESYPRQCWSHDGQHFVEDLDISVDLVGEITCLPKLGDGPQTMECAIGLKGDDGEYYGLSNLAEIDPDYEFSAGGERVEVRGLFKADSIDGPDGNKYNILGVIELTSIELTTAP